MRVRIVCAAVFLIALGAGPARAARWTAQPAPMPAGSTGALFDGVSCAAGACTAVGSFAPTDLNDQALAERRRGAGWAIQQTPDPPGVSGGGGVMTAVSCAGPNRCEAVGDTDDTIGNFYFAEGWNGRGWTLQNIPEPADDGHSLDNPPDERLNGISCPKLNFCIAVGSYLTGAGATVPLTERWNGKTWKVLPRAKVAHGGVLDGVSCSGPRACVAVGGAIAERWNGLHWTVGSVAKPNAGHGTLLLDVSCASRRRCIAVGSNVGTSGHRVTLAEAWNGQSWALLRTPATQANSQLLSVSCPATGACTAVGFSRGGATSNLGAPLVEHWNGRRWTVQRVPSAGGQPSVLSAVSCSRATACTAVGDIAGTRPLAIAG